MFAAIKKNKKMRIQFYTFHHRNYMAIKSKAAKRLQNITANKRITQKRERLKSRYKEYYESVPIPTTFDARYPKQIALRYLMTQKRNPLPKYIIKQIEICTNVRITALYKQSPSALLNLPNVLQQIKKNDQNISSVHADILQKMILKSFLLPSTNQNNENAANQRKKQSEMNMFIGSILFEGTRDDIKHALQLYHFIEGLGQECSIKIPGIPNHILSQLQLENRRLFFHRKRSLSKFNDLFYDIKHTNCRRIKRFIDPAVTEQTKYISTMQNTKKKRDIRLIGAEVTDSHIVQMNENKIMGINKQQSVPSILTENRLQKLSKFVDTHLLSTKFTRQSDGTTDMVLYGSDVSKQLVHRKINDLAKSCFTLLVGDKKLPIILWQFPWLYWKVFTLTQCRAWEDFNKPGLLWVHGPEKWRTVKATKFLQTFLDNIDVIDINPKYYAAIVGHKGKMIETLQSECGATIFTYRHSQKRIEKNEQKEKETNEMMQRWKDRKIAKRKEYERRDKDPMSTEGIWKKWQQKTPKDPIKERESIEHQIEKLTNTRKWILPKIEFDEEWQNKLMIFGDVESKNAVRKYVNDIVKETVILPLSELEFRAIFHSMNYDKQKKEYLIKMEKRQKKMQKEYKNDRLQIHFYDLDNDKRNEQNQNEEIVEPFLYRREKLNHDALIKKMERELECILTFDDKNLYISNAQNVDSVLRKLKKLYLRCVWRPFHGIKDLKMSEFDYNLYRINKAMAHNKQIKRFLINPLADNPNYAQIKAVFDKYCSLQYFWDNERCELTLYGLREVVDAFAIDLQKYLQTFYFLKIDNLEQNNWLSIPHESIRESVQTIFKETGVSIFNLKKCEPILLSTNAQNLEIAKLLLLDLLESVERIFINPRQYEVAHSVMNELEKKYNCDIIINPQMNESKKEYEVNVIYHDTHLRDALIADFNQYLAKNELICFDFDEFVSPLYANDFSFCSEFYQNILNPLCKYYDVHIQNDEENKIKLLGHSDNVQFANKALSRFCHNVRGMFFDQKFKGLLIYKYLAKYHEQFPSIYYWYDSKKQCLWSSVIPIALREHKEYKQSLNESMSNLLMTDTATLQLQFDTFLNYLDYANANITCLYLGRHFSILMEENLPFELDLIEYIEEEKEMNAAFMDESKQNNENESRMEMISRMSNAKFEIDAENACIYILGTRNEMNVAYDLMKDIFCNVGYIQIDEYCAQILTHQCFSTTHGDIEMSHQSLLEYISKECQVKLDLVQAYSHEIDLLNVAKWNENIHLQQQQQWQNVNETDIANSNLLHLSSEKNLIFPDLYVVVYGNEMRQKLVKEQLDGYLSSIELDTESRMKTNKALAKMNRNQRRMLWKLFRIRRE